MGHIVDGNNNRNKTEGLLEDTIVYLGSILGGILTVVDILINGIVVEVNNVLTVKETWVIIKGSSLVTDNIRIMVVITETNVVGLISKVYMPIELTKPCRKLQSVVISISFRPAEVITYVTLINSKGGSLP